MFDLHRPDRVARRRRWPPAHGLVEVFAQLDLAQKVFLVLEKGGFVEGRIPFQPVKSLWSC